jgi:hypothetical protein
MAYIHMGGLTSGCQFLTPVVKGTHSVAAGSRLKSSLVASSTTVRATGAIETGV